MTEQLVSLLQTFTKAWKAPGRLERGTDFTSALHLAVKCCGHLLVQTSVLLPKLNTAGHTAAPGTKASPFIPMLVPRNSPRTRAVSGSILQRPRKGYPGYVNAHICTWTLMSHRARLRYQQVSGESAKQFPQVWKILNSQNLQRGEQVLH